MPPFCEVCRRFWTHEEAAVAMAHEHDGLHPCSEPPVEGRKTVQEWAQSLAADLCGVCDGDGYRASRCGFCDSRRDLILRRLEEIQ